ncbi:MAG TPA: hypothetical protein VF611_20830, partial [Pyrinomonadaceae bacterium]
CIVGGLEVLLNDVTSYKKQPHQENVQTSWPFKAFSKGAQDGPGYVFLRVFLTEVDDTADTDLQNQTDIGFETTLREKVDWEILLSDEQFAGPNYMMLAEYFVKSGAAEVWEDRRVRGMTLETVRTDLDELRQDYEKKTASLNPGGDLAPNSVGTANLKDNAVNTAKIQDASVTASKLTSASVTTPKLAEGAVTTGKLLDGAVTAQKLGDLSVTTGKLSDGSVNHTKLAANSVDSAKLVANAVGYGKVAASAITVAQFKTMTTLNTSFTMAASATTSLVLLHKVFVGPDNFVIYTVWSDEDLSWSEYMLNGSRMLKITNNTAATITVNVMARLVFAS